MTQIVRRARPRSGRSVAVFDADAERAGAYGGGVLDAASPGDSGMGAGRQGYMTLGGRYFGGCSIPSVYF